MSEEPIETIIEQNLALMNSYGPKGMACAFSEMMKEAVSGQKMRLSVAIPFCYDSEGKIRTFEPESRDIADYCCGELCVEALQKRKLGIVPGKIDMGWVEDLQTNAGARRTINNTFKSWNSETETTAGPITRRKLVYLKPK